MNPRLEDTQTRYYVRVSSQLEQGFPLPLNRQPSQKGGFRLGTVSCGLRRYPVTRDSYWTDGLLHAARRRGACSTSSLAVMVWSLLKGKRPSLARIFTGLYLRRSLSRPKAPSLLGEIITCCRRTYEVHLPLLACYYNHNHTRCTSSDAQTIHASK